MGGTKSTGFDCIDARLLKIGSKVLSLSISFIINKIIISGVFVNFWKRAKVKPIYKSGAKDELNNYRSISILPTLLKLDLKLVHM